MTDLHGPTCPCGDPGTRWHTGKGPLFVLTRLHGQRWYRARWMDHTYRVRGRDYDHGLRDVDWVYVAEPYHLDPDAFPDLLALEAAGFTVHITAWAARHLPGHTTAILIYKAAA